MRGSVSDADFGPVVRADDPCGAENGGAGACVPNKYLHARYYDPTVGLFLSPDSLHPGKRGVGTNRYAYAFGNPVNGTDRSGREMRCAIRTQEEMQGSQTYEVYYNESTGQFASELVRNDTYIATVMSLDCTFFENGPGDGLEFVRQERLVRENLFNGILDPVPPVIDSNPTEPASPPEDPPANPKPPMPPSIAPTDAPNLGADHWIVNHVCGDSPQSSILEGVLQGGATGLVTGAVWGAAAGYVGTLGTGIGVVPGAALGGLTGAVIGSAAGGWKGAADAGVCDALGSY